MSRGGAIKYAVIAQSQFAGASDIVAEVSDGYGDFSHVVEVILERCTGNTKKSYASEGHIFNYIVNDGTTYLCVSDKEFPTRISFAYLGKLMEEYDGQSDFEGRMKSWMEYYSTNPEADKIRSVQAAVDNVKTQVMENIEATLQRGDRLEDVVVKSDALLEDSSNFKRGASQLKSKLYFKNIKLTIIIVIVLLLAACTCLVITIVVVIVVACGFLDLCRGSSSSSSS